VIHRDEKHYDKFIDMTDARWENCTFDGCVLLMKDTRDTVTHVESCNFWNCKLEGDGWPDSCPRLPKEYRGRK